MKDNRMLNRRPFPQLKHILQKGKFVSPSLLAACLVLLITAIALFVKPYIGMADNGDYFRILNSNGLYFNEPTYEDQYFGYFVKSYGIYQYYHEVGTAFFSSQSLFIQLALGINHLFHPGAVFDIRYQAAVYTLLYCGAIYLLVESLTWRIPRKYGYPIAILAVFLFADTAYTAYFNSFFGESVVWIMMLYVFASGLLFYRRRYNDYFQLALFAVSALLLTTSKQQNAPMGMIIAVTGIFLVLIRKDRAFRISMSGVLAIIMLAGIGTYVLIPKEFVNINKYHAMTRGILQGASDPEATLEGLGIDRQYAILNGTIHYEPYTTVGVNSDLLENNFYSKYGFGSILLYYFRHPDQAGNMLNLAAKDAFLIRPPAMGNYEQSVGKPFGAQTRFFSAYSLLKEQLAPKTFGFIVIWCIIVVGLYLPAFITALKARNWRNALRLPLIVTLILVGLSGIFVSIIGAGDADLAKHEFAFTAAFDLVTFLTVSDLIRRRLWQSEQASPSPDLPTRPLAEAKSLSA